MNQPVLSPANIISAEELKSQLDSGCHDVFIVDVRCEQEVEQNGKIASKQWINVPHTQLESILNLGEEEFKKKFGMEKFADDGSKVVIHCAVGGRGVKATLAALRLGYSKIRHLDGGHNTWKKIYPN